MTTKVQTYEYRVRCILILNYFHNSPLPAIDDHKNLEMQCLDYFLVQNSPVLKFLYACAIEIKL